MFYFFKTSLLRHPSSIDLIDRPICHVSSVRAQPSTKGLWYVEQLVYDHFYLFFAAQPVETLGNDLDYIVGGRVQPHLPDLWERVAPRYDSFRPRAPAPETQNPIWINISHPCLFDDFPNYDLQIMGGVIRYWHPYRWKDSTCVNKRVWNFGLDSSAPASTSSGIVVKERSELWYPLIIRPIRYIIFSICANLFFGWLD